MFSLIYVILSIALLSLVVIASINYLPWWAGTASNIEKEAHRAVAIVQNAYNFKLEETDGIVPPVQINSPDGGLFSNFPSIVFNPLSRGFSVSYGESLSNPAPYGSLKWVCFYKSDVDEGTLRGLKRASARFPSGQAILNETCGSYQNKNETEPFNSIAFTYYLTYSPNIDE